MCPSTRRHWSWPRSSPVAAAPKPTSRCTGSRTPGGGRWRCASTSRCPWPASPPSTSTPWAIPFKRYHIAPVWRGENPQKGRYREFVQCDFDTIGTESAVADIETVLVVHDLFAAVGAGPFTIRVNDRRILNAVLAAMGLAGRSEAVLRALDRIGKVGCRAGGRRPRGAGCTAGRGGQPAAPRSTPGAADGDALDRAHRRGRRGRRRRRPPSAPSARCWRPPALSGSRPGGSSSTAPSPAASTTTPGSSSRPTSTTAARHRVVLQRWPLRRSGLPLHHPPPSRRGRLARRRPAAGRHRGTGGG